MRTILNKKEQLEFIENNHRLTCISHKWSSRGYGNSNIIDNRGDRISRATGCGYDRFGTVIGMYIEATFNEELTQLAKRFCKTGYVGKSKSSKAFYGLFMREDGSARLDGGCGYDCMYRILNAIGFELVRVGEWSKSNNGEEYFELRPIDKHARERISRIK